MRSKFDKYKDFCIREVWIKPKDEMEYSNRILLRIDEKYFHNACQHPDVYYSIRRYPEEARMIHTDHIHEFDSVSGLFFDIDAHAEGIRTRQLIDAAYSLGIFVTRELDLLKDELFIWFSGRGFHLAVPPEIIMASPNCGSEQNFKLFAQWCKRSVTLHANMRVWNFETQSPDKKTVSLLDTSIYHRRALIRVPGTANSKSRFRNNYKKTYMPFDALERIARQKDNQEQINMLTLVIRENPWKYDTRWV